MDSTWLCSFLLTVITGPVLPFPGQALALVPVTEESYKQAVLPPFLDGLNSLNSVAAILLTSTDLQQGIPNNVRQLLESSFKSLSEAEQLSQAQERAVSTNVEKCVNMMKKLEDEQTVLKDQHERLNGQRSGLQVQDSLARDQLRAAQEAVNNANDAVHRGNQAKRDAERNKGIGLMFIPFFGPIIGDITISEANKAFQAAEREGGYARQRISTLMDEANKYSSKSQSLRNEITVMKQTIAAKVIEIQAKELDLSQEKSWGKNLQEFLIPLRKCTTLLGTVESTNVVELIEKLNGLLPALDDIIEAVRPLIVRSSNYQLLISTTVLTIIAKLEEANRSLKNL